MTREDIIRMARKAGFEIGSVTNSIYAQTSCETELQRFAALVAAEERTRTWTQEHWTEYERSIAATEREACARLVDLESRLMGKELQSAAAIRARGQA